MRITDESDESKYLYYIKLTESRVLESNAVLAFHRQAEIITCFNYVNKGPKSQFICSAKRISMTTTTLVLICIWRSKVLRNTMAEQHGERENGDEFVNKLKKFQSRVCEHRQISSFWFTAAWNKAGNPSVLAALRTAWDFRFTLTHSACFLTCCHL